MTSIAENLAIIRGTMQDALRQVAREDAPVDLIAVSKTKPAEDVQQALVAGQRLFGENRVQEAASKFPQLKTAYPDLELHLIGPLQTNKVEQAVKLFDVIQTLDRTKMAEALAKAKIKFGMLPKLYIEVNIGHEPQKAGIEPEHLDNFLQFCRQDCGLEIHGLMCIPPHDVDPMPYFRQMRQLADHYALPQLSMGMSGDYTQAIMAGATQIRVGSAIFGERPPVATSENQQ